MAEQDRSTIGLSPDALKHLEEIQHKEWFDDAQDVARFAVAYAVRTGLEAGVTHGVDTRWSVSGFDKTGEFRAIVAGLYPGVTRPIRTLEHLANEGLRLIHERLVTRGETPAQLLDGPAPS